jgi:hypothetical protein
VRRNGKVVCTYSKNNQFPTYHYHASCSGFHRGDKGELNFGVSWQSGNVSWLYTTKVTFTV